RPWGPFPLPHGTAIRGYPADPHGRGLCPLGGDAAGGRGMRQPGGGEDTGGGRLWPGDPAAHLPGPRRGRTGGNPPARAATRSAGGGPGAAGSFPAATGRALPGGAGPGQLGVGRGQPVSRATPVTGDRENVWACGRMGVVGSVGSVRSVGRPYELTPTRR